MRRFWLLGTLLLDTTAIAQPAKPAGVCLKTADDPVLVEVDRGKLKYCFDHGKSLTCYSTDLEDGSLWVTAAPAHNGGSYPSTPRGTDEVTVEGTESAIKVCQPNSTECKTFKPKDAVDPGLGLNAAANRAGTIAALTNGSWVETFDIKSGKRLAHFKAGPTKGRACSYIDFVGDAIVVDHYDCGDVKISDTWIGTKLGKRLSAIGGKTPIGMTTNGAQIDDKRTAFVSRTGDRIAVHDIKTGKLLKQITIGPPTDDVAPVLAFGESSEDNQKLAMVFGDSRVGDVVIVDLATDKVSTYPANRCKPTPRDK